MLNTSHTLPNSALSTAPSRLPMLDMAEVLRDPAQALMKKPAPGELGRRALRFLHSCTVCLAPPKQTATTAGWAGRPPGQSEPTLLFHASNRQPPCGAAARGFTYWAARATAIYARRHAYEYAFFDTTKPVAELWQAQAQNEQVLPAQFNYRVVVAQFSKSALLLALATDGPWKLLVYLDDDAGVSSPTAPPLPAILGGVSSHVCSGRGATLDELMSSVSADGSTRVVKSLYYERMHPGDPKVVGGVERLMVGAAQPNVWEDTMQVGRWEHHPTGTPPNWRRARADRSPLRGWADDCPVNSGVLMVGTCASARRLLEAWYGLAPQGAKCPAMVNWHAASNDSGTAWAEGVGIDAGHPLHVCPCSVRCKDQHALNALLEDTFPGAAVVANETLLGTPYGRYFAHAYCGSSASKDACNAGRNRTTFKWVGAAATSGGAASALDGLVPPAIPWKAALQKVKARHATAS